KSVSLLAGGDRAALGYASRYLIFTAEEMAHLLGRPVANPFRFLLCPAGVTPIARLYDLELRHFLRNQLLRDGDQMSMAVSLELRAPFVDHRLVDTITRIPARFKIVAGRQKPLLGDAIDHPMITTTAARPKLGFPLPLRRWMREEIDTSSI